MPLNADGPLTLLGALGLVLGVLAQGSGSIAAGRAGHDQGELPVRFAAIPLEMAPEPARVQPEEFDGAVGVQFGMIGNEDLREAVRAELLRPEARRGTAQAPTEDSPSR